MECDIEEYIYISLSFLLFSLCCEVVSFNLISLHIINYFLVERNAFINKINIFEN